MGDVKFQKAMLKTGKDMGMGKVWHTYTHAHIHTHIHTPLEATGKKGGNKFAWKRNASNF